MGVSVSLNWPDAAANPAENRQSDRRKFPPAYVLTMRPESAPLLCPDKTFPAIHHRYFGVDLFPEIGHFIRKIAGGPVNIPNLTAGSGRRVVWRNGLDND